MKSVSRKKNDRKTNAIPEVKYLAVGWQTQRLSETNSTIFIMVALNLICPMNGFSLAKPSVWGVLQRNERWGWGCAFYTGHYDMRHRFPLRAVNKSFQTTTTITWNCLKTQYHSIPVGIESNYAFDLPCILLIHSKDRGSLCNANRKRVHCCSPYENEQR